MFFRGVYTYPSFEWGGGGGWGTSLITKSGRVGGGRDMGNKCIKVYANIWATCGGGGSNIYHIWKKKCV